MGWVLSILAATLGLVFLWGVFAPRSQWRALSAWSVSDEHTHEPGGAAYGWRRFVSALGVLGIGAVVAVTASSAVASIPQQQPTRTNYVQLMWGSPTPEIIDRTITPIAAPPEGLVEVPIEDYQSFNEDDGLPDYLSGLDAFTYLGALEVPGFIGTIPDVGFSALDFADLVVHVRGPILCIPRQAVVIESETDIKIGIYYGAPLPADGSQPDNAAVCATDASITSSVLLPLNLSAPVGDRVVTMLDGTELTDVELQEPSVD